MHEENGYIYDAFMSYRHTDPDKELARQMHIILENYRLPLPLRSYGEKRNGLLFLDKAELPVSEDLRRDIELALDRSQHLIVICSPNTPGSDWIDWEIDHFLETNSPEKIIILLIDGDLATSLPEPLQIYMPGSSENEAGSWFIEGPRPLLVDMRYDSQKEQRRVMLQAALSIIAAFVGCEPSKIEKADRLSKIARNSFLVAGVAAIFVLFGLFCLQQMRYAKVLEQSAQKSKDLNLSVIEVLTTDIQDQLEDVPGTLSIRYRMMENNIRLLNEIVQMDKSSPQAEMERVFILDRSGDLWMFMGKTDKANEAFEQALEIELKLEKDNNSKYPVRINPLTGYYKIAYIRTIQGRLNEATVAIHQSLWRVRRLAQSHPGQQSQELLACVLEEEGWIYRGSGKDDEAKEALEEAQKIRKKIAAQKDTEVAWEALISTNVSLGEINYSIGKRDDAQALFEEDLNLARQKTDLNNTDMQNIVWGINSNLARINADTENLISEKKAIDEMLVLAEHLGKDKEDKVSQHCLAVSYITLGNYYHARQEFTTARQSYEQAETLLQSLAGNKENRTVQGDQIFLYGYLSDLAYIEGYYTRARAELAKKQDIILSLPKIFDDYNMKLDLASLYYQKGTLSLAEGNKPEALENYRLVAELYSKLARQRRGTNSKQLESNACSVRAWINILSNKPEKALQEAQDSIKGDPHDCFPVFRVYLAHACLFGNHRDQALQLYKENRDQRVNNTTFFADQVLRDFKDLRKAGITHPDMAEVEAMMRPASGGRMLVNTGQEIAN